METNGWIKMYRCIIDDNFYNVKPFDKTHAWIDLILMAKWKEETFTIRNIEVTIKRGQLAAGKDFLANKWGWSKRKVIDYLRRLEIKQQITQQITNVITIISITNYEKYQSTELQTAQQITQQITLQTAQQTAHILRSKEYKEYKEKETLRVSKKKDELSFSDQETPSTSNLFEQDSTVQETNVNVNVLKEKELNEKKKKSANDEYKCLAQQVVDIWNSECTTLPKVSKLTPARETKIIQRLKEFGNPNDCLTTYNDIITKINKSDFLLGNKTDWKITFDWLFVNSTNWLKISEGVYDNKDNINTNTPNTTKKYPDYVYELPPAERKRRQLMGIS